MKKEYLITYHFIDKNGNNGLGNMSSYIKADIKIDSNVVENWREFLKDKYDLKQIVILNIMSLDNL